MDILTYRDYCLSFPGATEDLPFDDNTLCFKAEGKSEKEGNSHLTIFGSLISLLDYLFY